MSTNCPIAHWLARLSAQVVQAGARAAVAEALAAEVASAKAQARAEFAEEEARAAGAVAARVTEESRVASRRARAGGAVAPFATLAGTGLRRARRSSPGAHNSVRPSGRVVRPRPWLLVAQPGAAASEPGSAGSEPPETQGAARESAGRKAPREAGCEPRPCHAAFLIASRQGHREGRPNWGVLPWLGLQRCGLGRQL